MIFIFDFWGVIYNPSSNGLTPGLRAFLVQLYERDAMMGIASSSDRAYIEEFLERNELSDYFSIIVGANEVSRRKPNPECYLNVAAFFDAAPEQCIVIDDSIDCIEEARDMEFRTIWFGEEVSSFDEIDLDELTS